MTVIPKVTPAQLRLLHELVREGIVVPVGPQVRPMRALLRQGLAEAAGFDWPEARVSPRSTFRPTDYGREVVRLPEMALPASLTRAQRAGTHGWMNSTFEARELPQAIWIQEECIAGPFCVHCGNPFSLHGDGLRCPDKVLHPVFPGPACRCHGELKSGDSGA